MHSLISSLCRHRRIARDLHVTRRIRREQVRAAIPFEPAWKAEILTWAFWVGSIFESSNVILPRQMTSFNFGSQNFSLTSNDVVASERSVWSISVRRGVLAEWSFRARLDDMLDTFGAKLKLVGRLSNETQTFVGDILFPGLAPDLSGFARVARRQPMPVVTGRS